MIIFHYQNDKNVHLSKNDIIFHYQNDKNVHLSK